MERSCRVWESVIVSEVLQHLAKEDLSCIAFHLCLILPLSLSRAQGIFDAMHNFSIDCRMNNLKSYLIPATTDVGLHWRRLLNFPDTRITYLQQTIQWCTNSDQSAGSALGTSSVLADALLKSETGAKLLEIAVAHSEAVSVVDKVEKSVAEVEDLLAKVRSATPLGDIDTCLDIGHVLATYVHH